MDPNGRLPVFNPNESRVPTIVAVTSFVLRVAAVAVSLGIYTRAVILKQLGIDDWMAVFTFVGRTSSLPVRMYRVAKVQIQFLIFACGFCVVWSTCFH